MKYLTEYRNDKLVKKLLEEIRKVVRQEWMLMEICGGQTHSLVRNGILDMLPREITMAHGPGCPVCVTPLSMIDAAVSLCMHKNIILCSFGDMVRVPGKQKSLAEARAEGGNVRIVYSPLDALTVAKQHPQKQVVFFAVGFETTAPANALAILQAASLGLKNFSMLVSHVLVPPAMEAILDDELNTIQGFLAAGHVCTVMGLKEYYPIAERYNIPVVVTGFEPADLLQGILMAVQQLEEGKAVVENQYARVTDPEGNIPAQKILREVFETADREWRGIGMIPMSGYIIRQAYRQYDAEYRFSEDMEKPSSPVCNGCIAGEILRGVKKPKHCPHFGAGCTPTNPMGAPMVSAEGACAAYYHFHQPTTSIAL